MRPDRPAAASRTLSRIFAEPLTWLPFLPIAAAYAFVGAPWWLCTPIAALLGAGLVAWWKRRWPQLYDRARVENLTAWLEKENAQFEKTLREVCPRIRWRRVLSLAHGEAERAISPALLDDALRQKKLLEAKILGDGLVTTDEEDLSRLVSDLFQNITYELERLAKFSASEGADEAGASATLKAIADACATIQQAGAEVEQLIDPVAALGEPAVLAERRKIERDTERLRERIQQAAAIKRRVAESLQTESPPAPTTEPERQ